jgi:hypothetical protein
MSCFVTVIVSLLVFFGMLYVLWDYFNEIPTCQIRRQYVIALLKSYPILFSLLTVNLIFTVPINALLMIILGFIGGIIIDNNNNKCKQTITNELRSVSIGIELQNIVIFFWTLVLFSIGLTLFFTVLIIMRFEPILQGNKEYIVCEIIITLTIVGHVIFFISCILQFFNIKETITVLPNEKDWLEKRYDSIVKFQNRNRILSRFIQIFSFIMMLLLFFKLSAALCACPVTLK